MASVETDAEVALLQRLHPGARYFRVRHPGVTLLGDAAHPITPNLGLGACLAIEDAAALAQCLAQHGLGEAALRDYEQRRAPRAQRIAKASRGRGRLTKLEGRAAVWLRDLLLGAIPAALLRRQLLRNAH